MNVKSNVPTYGECFASLALGFAPLSLLCAIAAMFGADTVHANGQATHGVGAIFLCIFVDVAFAAIFAGLQKLGYVFLGFIPRKGSKVEA